MTGQVQALGILLNSIFSKNQDIEDLLPPEFEAVLKGNNESEVESDFIAGDWWRKSGS